MYQFSKQITYNNQSESKQINKSGILYTYMPKRTANKNKGQTPKSQKLKKDLQQKMFVNEQQKKVQNVSNNQNQNQQLKVTAKDNNNEVKQQGINKHLQMLQQIPHHTKSQIKKQISISSQNFVMCRNTNFEADYQVIDKIGEGSFGSVFKIRHRILKIQRALKKIRKNPQSKFSSFQQIEVLKKLDHSSILKIYEFYENEQYYLIVTQLFQGKQLFDQIINSEKINEQVAVRIIKQVLLALNYTHSMGIAHRDIKPQNILVRDISDNNKCKIKIIDWGLGTLVQQQSVDRVCGTPQYAAPEIFQGKYSVLCDMWSLGVLTFILLTGNMPFKGTNTQQTINQVKRSIINYRKSGFNDLSNQAKQFITELIQKDPKKRMSASQALKHKWIVKFEQVKQQPVLLKQTLNTLKQLNISNHFGAAVLNLINNHFSTCQQKQKLQEIFKFLDTNGDGVLSHQQLISGYSKIYGQEAAKQIAAATFSKLDVNNSGTLQYSQFIAYGLRRQKQKERQKLKQAFDLIDEDRNGTISWKQVGRILQGKLEVQYQQDMKFLLSEFEGKKNQQVNFQQFQKFMEKLLQKVDDIRESKKRQSQFKVNNQGQANQQKNRSITLKRTESISQQMQQQKVQQNVKKQQSKSKPKRKRR